MQTNGAAVKALRQALGWKVCQLASAVGISASYLTNIEKQRRQPAPDVRVRIAHTLDVPLAAIIRQPCSCGTRQKVAA